MALKEARRADNALHDPVTVARVIRAIGQLYQNPLCDMPYPATYTGFDRPTYQKKVGKVRILYDVVDRLPEVWKIGMVKDLFPRGTQAAMAHK